MKKVILTDENTIKIIDKHINFINNHIKDFVYYLGKQNLDDDINENIYLYSSNIVEAGETIKKLINITE